MKVVELTKAPVELYKFLKFENLVASGGEAKHVIAQGLVKVNGVAETRKSRKLFNGDVVVFGDTEICLRVKG